MSNLNSYKLQTNKGPVQVLPFLENGKYNWQVVQGNGVKIFKTKASVKKHFKRIGYKIISD